MEKQKKDNLQLNNNNSITHIDLDEDSKQPINACSDTHNITINSQKENSCSNEKKPITREMKIVMLKMVLDDTTFKIYEKENKIDEAFDYNLANIIIATRGQF
jgi:hypothetical protein